ncbi:MAG: coniferyl aldehyde dehydrogenase [Pseudomonadota bacterium]
MSVAEQKLADTQDQAVIDNMHAILNKQKQAHIKEGPPDAKTRLDRLDRAIAVLVDNEKAICEALSDDFGHRSPQQSRITDVYGSIEPLKFAKKNLTKWMKTEKRKVQFPLNLFGSGARIEYQPLGTIGIISPWNFPVNLTFAPLAGVFAAGNRTMIKPSEFTPTTSALMAEMLQSAFDESEVAVFTGGPAIGATFSTLPFDHLLFTGATSIARHVMRAASENLVPVTLELGGKSPVIVGRSADMQKTGARVVTGKMMNAGQICLAPDYTFVPEEHVEEFVAAAKSAVESMYPTLKDNADYTSVINHRHYERLQGYVEEAKTQGAEVVEINPANEDFSTQSAHKMPPVLVLNPDENLKVMQDEIFGPVLPVKTYKDIDEAIQYVNEHPRPLGLYYFGSDKAEEQKVLSRTTSGGVTVNDVVMHVSMEDLPFGGVGPSGMGAYHGYDGFKTFSHAKAVYSQTKSDMLGAMLRPPYGEKLDKMLDGFIKK